MLGVSHVVTTSVGMCDIDIRPVSATLVYGIRVSFRANQCPRYLWPSFFLSWQLWPLTLKSILIKKEYVKK